MPDTVESNPLFPLLTDALRAGPGSPEWHQAVSKLRAAGLADSDEYKMLVTVREHLASGRDYRSIRAGPGFTKKVFEAIEEERKAGPAKPPRRLPLATIIAVISIVVVLGIVGYVGYRIYIGNPTPQPHGTVEELAGIYFPKTAAQASFDSGIPAGWREVGSARMPLKADKTGIRPEMALPSAPATNASAAIGHAIVSTVPLSADDPFAVEVKLKLGRQTEDLIVQIFVSSETDFSEDKATSSNEIAWLVRGGRQEIRLDQARAGAEPSSQMVYDAPRPPADTATVRAEPLTMRINVNHDFAAVFNGQQQFWAGGNGLAAKARTVGVRFLYTDPSKPLYDPPVVQSIRVLTK